MSTTARDLLAAFEALGADDKREVTREILLRSVGADDLSNEAFDDLATAVFQSYDAEEAGSAEH